MEFPSLLSPKCVVLNHPVNAKELQHGAFKNDFAALDFICMFVKKKSNILMGYTFILGHPVGFLG